MPVPLLITFIEKCCTAIKPVHGGTQIPISKYYNVCGHKKCLQSQCKLTSCIWSFIKIVKHCKHSDIFLIRQGIFEKCLDVMGKVSVRW